MIGALALVLALHDPAEQFCRAITANAPQAFAPLAESDDALLTHHWQRARDLVVSGFDCIEISSYRSWTEPSGRIVVDLDGSGITRNAKRERRPIPHLWYLTLNDDRSAITD